MIKFIPTSIRPWLAASLALVFVSFWASKTLHVLLSDHHHADHPVCAAGTTHAGLHLHDERYATDDCAICAFVLAIPEVIHITVVLNDPMPAPTVGMPCYLPPSCADLAHDTTCRRGPPARV